jgi:hypothetical protein
LDLSLLYARTVTTTTTTILDLSCQDEDGEIVLIIFTTIQRAKEITDLQIKQQNLLLSSCPLQKNSEPQQVINGNVSSTISSLPS